MKTDVLATRSEMMMDFLVRLGWADASIAPLAGDASNRRYLRLTKDAESAVLMDAPPETGEDVRPFVAVGAWLETNGFSAPQTYGADFDQGFLLIEDLGDTLYSRHVVHQPADEAMLYAQAIRVLVSLADCPPPKTLGTGAAETALPSYDRATLDREAGLLTEWYLPATTGTATAPAVHQDFIDLVAQATTEVAGVKDTVVLRDYHAENLLWLPHRSGLRQVGLIDYQDALAGHAAYDLVSLLEDARRDTSDDLRAAMIDLYLSERPDLDREAFRAAYAALGAQRNMKIIGIFTRLARRDGKPGYLKLIPRVWAHLQRDLSHPALTSLSAWVGRYIPAPEEPVLMAIKECVP